MWSELNTIDAKAITLDAVRNAEKWHAYAMAKVREEVQKIYEKEVRANNGDKNTNDSSNTNDEGKVTPL